MKNYLLLLPILICLASTAPAQQVEFAPTGAEWFYSYQSGWGLFEGFFHAQSLGDTLLNGRVCKKICTSYYSQPTTPPYCKADSWLRYLYQQGDSIFEVGPDTAYVPRLMFRTDFQVGDSLHYYYRAFVVTGIDTLTFHNQPVRRFQLDDGFGTKPIIYDRFGPQDGLFDYSWGVIADGPSFQLRCYQDDHFAQVHLSSEACDLVVNTEEPFSNLHMYPNPARDFIYFIFDGNIPSNMQFQILDVSGRLVRDRLEFGPGNTIDVHTLPAGFYILMAKAGDAKAQRKFVKQ